MSKPKPNVRLDELDREEWWDVARKAKPTITREEFDRDWVEFVRLKRDTVLVLGRPSKPGETPNG